MTFTNSNLTIEIAKKFVKSVQGRQKRCQNHANDIVIIKFE